MRSSPLRAPSGACIAAAALAFALVAGRSSAQTNYARDLVNPFVGTGGHGHTFPGACVPNGLVQLSPDTRPDGNMDWDGCGGYHYSDSIIYGFSHTHLSGTGVADLCDVLLMPVTGMHGEQWLRLGYRQRFSHASEKANAGYYTVELTGPAHSDAAGATSANDVQEDYHDRIGVELTATPRVGIHRYTFPAGQDARVIINLSHRDDLKDFSIVRTSDTEVVGERRSSSWAKDQRLFFCIRFSKPLLREDVMPATRYGRTACYNFGPLDAPLVVAVGISAVSVEGARKNLEAEVPGWNFNVLRKQAEDAWNAKLSKIQVSGGSRNDQRTFYSALYHCYVAPYVFNDVDGNYRGIDGQVHHAAHKVYTVFSLWDTFRALHPLMTILEPEMTSDFINTFLLHYQQGGKLPVWELWANETNCMIGYHSVSVIADAYVKGIRGFDAELALEAMVASATANDAGLNAYRAKGYISSEDQSESVSKTLEYAYDDWCIAQMASEMRKTPGWDVERAMWLDSVSTAFYARSRNWQNLFDPNTRFFRARRNGGFIEPFDSYEVNFHYTEANAWQYSMFVPHDLVKYSELMSTGFYGHLNELFSTRSGTTGRDQADITGSIGQYAHGNEPSHHMAYLYRSAPGYDKVRRILTELYNAGPDGLAGNEDCGQMSAWFVMSAMGIYPVSPGCDRYWTGISLFDEVKVTLPNGKLFTVDARSLTGARSTTVEPEPWPSISHGAILQGTTLSLSDGPQTDPHRTTSPFRTDLTVPPAPIIQAASSTFMDSLQVNITCIPGPWKLVRVPVSGPEIIADPDPQHMALTLRENAVVSAYSVDASGRKGPLVTAHFNKIDGSRTIKLETPYANQYAAGGDRALLDAQRGGKDFRTGEWQGYQGQDIVAMVDLGSVKELERAGLSVLQDQGSWIWFPSSITIAWSTNGRTWSSAEVDNTIAREADGGQVQELWTGAIDKQARYIKVIAKNAGPCPDWHPGKGGPSWIFADEILLETRTP